MSRYGPFQPRDRFGDPFISIRRELNRMIDDFGRFAGPATSGEPRMALARVDMSETQDAIEIDIEAPGVAEQGLDISLQHDVLVVRATRETARDARERNWHVRERAVAGVTRSITLPFAPEPDAISARLQNGVLHVRIQKASDQARRSVRIPIGGGASGQRVDDRAGQQSRDDAAI